MKILHSADIHLRVVGDPRWTALEAILWRAEKEGVKLVVISGDMFDRQVDTHKLKVPLRELFKDIPFQIVIIPGNHDGNSLSDGDYYGDQVRVIADASTFIDVGKVRVHGLPFEKIVGEKVIERVLSVRGNLRLDACNILLYHGELLDLSFSKDSFGEEEAGYMPVRLSFFDDVGFDYVLAGHFHSNFEVLRYEGGYFVYPGSPVSITRKETGPRRVNLFEVGETPSAVELQTNYYEDVTVVLDPFSADDPMSVIRARLAECADAPKILLTVTGFVDLAALGKTELEFATVIRALKGDRVDAVAAHWHDISSISDSDLFKRFSEQLARTDYSAERKRAIRDLVLESMMEAKHAG